MSAAIWDEPPEAHPGLGGATLRADELPGRDSTLPAQPRVVRLRLWGATTSDVEEAARKVWQHPDSNRWTVSATEQHVARCTTIRPNDPDAIAQRAGYGWAWAAYPHTA